MKTDLEMVVELCCALTCARCPGNTAPKAASIMFNKIKKWHPNKEEKEEKENE